MAEKKIVDLVVKDNIQETEGHLKDLSSQIKTSKKDVQSLGDSFDELNQSATNVDATFEEVYGDLKPLTARMGEAEDRLYELSLAGKQGTKEFQALLTSVGNYRKVQIQTDLAVDSAATTMTQKLGGSLEYVSGAFAATQGAMAIFGKENKSVEQAILKVQSALAITQGFAAMREGANSVKQLGTAIKSLTIFQTAYNFVNNATSTGLKVLRGALIATGIGALVVGVGLLIANFDKLKAAALKLVPGLALIGNAIGGVVNSITDFVGITSEAGRAMEKMQESAEKSLKSNAKFLKEHGSQIDQYTKQKIDAVNEYYEALKEDGANQVALKKELDRKLAKIDKERADADKAKAKEIQDAKDAKLKEQQDKEKARKQKEADDFNEDLQQRGEKQFADYEEQLRLKIILERGKAKIDGKSKLDANAMAKAAMDKSLQDVKDNAAAEKAIEDAKAEARRQQFGSYAQLLGQSANLLGESTDAGKAAAIASTTISTYLAAQGAYASQMAIPTPDAPFRAVLAAGLAIASGLKNVQSIIDVQTPNGGGGGSAPAAETPRAPTFNVVGTSAASTNQIASTIGKDQAPVKAYVVANDVTTAQSLNRNIVSSASLG
jgi:hypothetical protein